MPGMDGLDRLPRAFARRSRVPMLMLTARGRRGRSRGGAGAGRRRLHRQAILAARAAGAVARGAAARAARPPAATQIGVGRSVDRHRGARRRGWAASRGGADWPRVRHPGGAGAPGRPGGPARDAAGRGGAAGRHGRRAHRRRARLAPAPQAGRRPEDASPHQDRARRRATCCRPKRPGRAREARVAAVAPPPSPPPLARTVGAVGPHGPAGPREDPGRGARRLRAGLRRAASVGPRVQGVRGPAPGLAPAHPLGAAPALRRAPAPAAVPLVRRGDLPVRGHDPVRGALRSSAAGDAPGARAVPAGPARGGAVGRGRQGRAPASRARSTT